MPTKKKRPVIAIDIDDVLANSAECLAEFSNCTWGTSLCADDYDENFMKLFGVSEEEARCRVNVLHESGAFANYRHKDSATSALRVLKNDYRLIILTSRQEFIKDDTLAWLEKKFPGVFDEKDVYFAGIYDSNDGVLRMVNRTKGNIAKELGADFLIDDQPKHCAGASELGIKAILFGDYSWNRAEVLAIGVHRAKTWDDVLRYFYEK